MMDGSGTTTVGGRVADGLRSVRRRLAGGFSMRPQARAGIGVPSMAIPLVAPNRSGDPEYFVAKRKRLATATSVRFLDDHHLVASHLVGQRLFLVSFDFDAGSCTIEDEIPTTFQGRPAITDLLDVDGSGGIAASNLHERAVSLYRIRDGKLVHERDLPIRDGSEGSCHGVRFMPPGDVICATCITNGRFVYFLSASTGEILYRFNDGEWVPKDVCFIDRERLLVISCSGGPRRSSGSRYESKAALIRLDLAGQRHERVSELVLPSCHVDGCAYADGVLYFTDAVRDCIRVCRVTGDALSLEESLPGYSFPHGIDVLPSAGLMAVTNYGSSDIVITRRRD
jgi:hypothetical protein